MLSKLQNKESLIPENLDNNPRVIKVNIPESYKYYQSGNGEGCFGYIETEEDYKKYDIGEGLFEVILLNSCWEYPELVYGSVIVAEGRGDNRPVMNWEWFKSITT
jgi:hypothetical protein